MVIASGGKLAAALLLELQTKYLMNRILVLISVLTFSVVNGASLILNIFPKIQESFSSAWLMISVVGSLAGTTMGLSLFFYFLDSNRKS